MMPHSSLEPMISTAKPKTCWRNLSPPSQRPLPSKLSQTQSHKKWNSPVFVLGAFFKQIVTAFNPTVKSTDLPWLSLYSCTRICATACRIMKALHYLTFRWATIPKAPNPRTITAKIPKPYTLAPYPLNLKPTPEILKPKLCNPETLNPKPL